MVLSTIQPHSAEKVQHDINTLIEAFSRFLSKFSIEPENQDTAKVDNTTMREFMAAVTAFLHATAEYLKGVSEYTAQLSPQHPQQFQATTSPEKGPLFDQSDLQAFKHSLSQLGQKIEVQPGTDFLILEKSAVRDFLKDAIGFVAGLQQTSQMQPESMSQADQVIASSPLSESQISHRQSLEKHYAAILPDPWDEHYHYHDGESENSAFHEVATVPNPIEEEDAIEAPVAVLQEPTQSFVEENSASTNFNPIGREDAFYNFEDTHTVGGIEVLEVDNFDLLEGYDLEPEAIHQSDRHTVMTTAIGEAPPQEPTIEIRPAQEVEAITGQEFGDTSQIHDQVLNQAPSVLITRDQYGHVKGGTALAAPIEVTEDALEVDLEVEKEREAYALTPEARSVVEDLRNYFGNTAETSLQGDHDYDIHVVNDDGMIFVPKNNPEESVLVRGSEIESDISQERYEHLMTRFSAAYEMIQVSQQVKDKEIELN